jgi:hypothetical protein
VSGVKCPFIWSRVLIPFIFLDTWILMVGIALAGQLAGILVLIAYIPYVLGTIRGYTKPNRATWFIWSVVCIIIAASYWKAGAENTLLVPLCNAFGTTLIALLSLKYGEGGWTRLDRTCLLASGISIVLWWLTGNPVVALTINILIDAIGAIPTMVKTYRDPKHENSVAWSIWLAAYFLNLFAIESWTYAIAAYPIYLFAQALMMVLLTYRMGKGGS